MQRLHRDLESLCEGPHFMSELTLLCFLLLACFIVIATVVAVVVVVVVVVVVQRTSGHTNSAELTRPLAARCSRSWHYSSEGRAGSAKAAGAVFRALRAVLRRTAKLLGDHHDCAG